MKFLPKSILLLFVLMVASACSAAFETAGLSADDAALLSSALNVDPTTASLDFDYTVALTINAEGETMIVNTAGRGITDPANGNSLISMSGSVSGVPDMGGETLPYDLEIRTINTNDVYIKGLAGLMDPSMDPAQWIYLPADMTTEMALSQNPAVTSTGLVQDGEVDVAGIYSAMNDNFFGTAGNYITAVRADDMDGMAHFTVSLQIGDWLTSDELSGGLEALAPLLAGDSVPADELETSLAQMQMGLGMAGMILDSGTYQLDYYVDPATGALGKAMITVAQEVDPAVMGGEGDPVTLNFVLDVNFNTFGPDSVVVAPEDFINPMGG